jgi:hypothetical protein
VSRFAVDLQRIDPLAAGLPRRPVSTSRRLVWLAPTTQTSRRPPYVRHWATWAGMASTCRIARKQLSRPPCARPLVRSSASRIIAPVLNPSLRGPVIVKPVTLYYREIRNVTRVQILSSLWLCGWLGCLLAYFVSAVFKARVTATRWRAHVSWSAIPLFALRGLLS